MISPDRMRRIDRWIGIPSCFLVSLVEPLARLWRRSKPLEYRKIVFISLAEIGAIVLAQPAIVVARELHPDTEVFFVTFPQGVGMLRLMGFTEHQILVIDTKSLLHLFISGLACIRTLRQIRIDAIINLEIFARFSTLLSWLSGAPVRAGFHHFHNQGQYVGNIYTHRLIYTPHHHIMQSYLSLVQAISDEGGREPSARIQVGDYNADRLRLSSDASHRGRVKALLEERFGGALIGKKLVLINANASDLIPVRRWPLAHFVSLSRLLLENTGVLIAMIGAAEEALEMEKLVAKIDNNRAISLAGATSLEELVELFHVAELLITNDSGPAHIASTTEIPTIVLFGPETPDLFGPTGPHQEALYLKFACSPCVSPQNQKRSPCTDNRCLKNIRPDVVYTHGCRLLEKLDKQE